MQQVHIAFARDSRGRGKFTLTNGHLVMIQHVPGTGWQFWIRDPGQRRVRIQVGDSDAPWNSHQQLDGTTWGLAIISATDIFRGARLCLDRASDFDQGANQRAYRALPI